MTIGQALQVFNFEDSPVRSVIHSDGEPRWVAVDVCRAMGVMNVSQVMDRVDEDHKGLYSVDTPGGPQSMLVVSEPGLLHLMFTGRSERAKRFRSWVLVEVLPTIRKTGKYEMASAKPDFDATDEMSVVLANMLRQRTEVLSIKKAQEAQLEILKATQVVAIEANETALKALDSAGIAESKADAAHLAITNTSGWSTTLGYCKFLKVDVPIHHLAQIGKMATKRCEDHGIEPQKVRDPRFGFVGLYPDKILEGLKSEFMRRSSNPN